MGVRARIYISRAPLSRPKSRCTTRAYCGGRRATEERLCLFAFRFFGFCFAVGSSAVVALCWVQQRVRMLNDKMVASVALATIVITLLSLQVYRLSSAAEEQTVHAIPHESIIERLDSIERKLEQVSSSAPQQQQQQQPAENEGVAKKLQAHAQHQAVTALTQHLKTTQDTIESFNSHVTSPELDVILERGVNMVVERLKAHARLRPTQQASTNVLAAPPVVAAPADSVAPETAQPKQEEQADASPAAVDSAVTAAESDDTILTGENAATLLCMIPAHQKTLQAATEGAQFLITMGCTAVRIVMSETFPKGEKVEPGGCSS